MTTINSSFLHRQAYRLLFFLVFVVDFIEPAALRYVCKAIPYLLLGFDYALQVSLSRRCIRTTVIIVFFLLGNLHSLSDNKTEPYKAVLLRENDWSLSKKLN